MGKHAHNEKIREKARAKATELNGEMIFELRHHDIFEFISELPVADFKAWADKYDAVEHTEPCKNRIALKYKEK